MEFKKITIKDIADALGITPSAVSKAMNDHPRISDRTKKAVTKTAEKMGYQPNHLASALRKGKSNLVGVIVPRAHSSFFSSVVQHMEEVLNNHGYKVIMTQSNESYKKECLNIDALLQIQVEGIIASLANETTNLEHYHKIKSKGVPLVLFDRGEDEIEVDYVGIDDYMSSELVIKHLVEQSYKRIAHIGGYKRTRIYKNRIQGYLDSLSKYGLPVEKELLLESGLNLEDGREKMEQLLKLSTPPDAVYVAGDYAALGALQVMKEHNIRVPADMGLVGFSNEPFTALITPSLSTVYQHNPLIGQLTAETFLQRMKNTQVRPSPNKIILTPELLIRRSSNRKDSKLG